MPVNVTLPVNVETPRTANRFVIPAWYVEHGPGGDFLHVELQAVLRHKEVRPIAGSSPPATETVEVVDAVTALPRRTYSGARLVAMMGDAGARYEALALAGTPKAMAFYRAIKGVLYDARKADGDIPADGVLS